jgi:hypothetical protein
MDVVNGRSYARWGTHERLVISEAVCVTVMCMCCWRPYCCLVPPSLTLVCGIALTALDIIGGCRRYLHGAYCAMWSTCAGPCVLGAVCGPLPAASFLRLVRLLSDCGHL